MAKKVSDSQVAGIKAHAEAKNKETIDKVNKAKMSFLSVEVTSMEYLSPFVQRKKDVPLRM